MIPRVHHPISASSSRNLKESAHPGPLLSAEGLVPTLPLQPIRPDVGRGIYWTMVSVENFAVDAAAKKWENPKFMSFLASMRHLKSMLQSKSSSRMAKS